ncbi:SNF2-related domain [Popillia japonica]|uniref:SNF2-related domain n=1 Tax=Popillia japonica TaxID=7064 RepID=A0AAW1MK13_POPJA
MSSATIKSHCLQVYTYITLAAEEAQKEMSIIDGGIAPESVMDRLVATLEFSKGIVQQLTRYMEDVEADIKELEQEISKEQTKKAAPPKRSKLALKKEKDPEYTQDEFLEIYKIDMTEDLNVPFQGVSAVETSTSTLDKLDNDNQTLVSTDDLLTSSVDIDENEALNKIGCDTSEIDSDSGHSLFSTDTLILETKTDKQSENKKDEHDEKESEHESTASDNDDGDVPAPDGNSHNLIMKDCSVVLSDCETPEQDVDTPRDSENDDKEMRDIEYLINLENLDRKRKLDQDDVTPKKSKRHKSKSTKLKNSSDISNSDSSDDNTDIDSLSPTLLGEDDIPSIPSSEPKVVRTDADFMKLLLDCISDGSDLLEDSNDDSSSSTDIDKNHNKKKSEDTVVEKPEIAEIQEEETVSQDDLLQISNIEVEQPKKSKWRKDKLLTEKLTDGSTDDEKENNPELKKKPRRKRRLRRKSTAEPVNSHNIIVSSSETDVKNDSEVDNLSVEILSFSSDSASDIEFVKAFSTNCEDEESESGKVGRRNIRTVQSDALLAETTKQAQKEEEERRERLFSQSQLFQLSQVTEVEGLILDIDKETKDPLITVDKNITNRLKDHQKEGVRFMWNSCYENVESLRKPGSGTGCILAHCMGLGKSFQVTALINTLFSHEITKTKHVLIICPLSTVLNWENEFEICALICENKVKIDRYLITDGKTKQQRHRVVIDWYKNKGVLIVGYDSFHSLLKTSENSNVSSVPKKVVEALLDPGPDLVVCDEGHLIKNGNLNRSKAIAKIKTKRRIILTGTPMQNNLTEYYYMVDFVKPNLLGTKKEFSNRFINPIVNGGYDNSTDDDIKLMRKRSHVLHDYLKDTIQRYEISELEQYLPDKVDYVIFIQLSPLQIELYKTCLDLVNKVSTERKGYLQDYMKLRDIWTHPGILKLKQQNKGLHQNKRKEIDTIGVEPEIQEDPGTWWFSKCPNDVLTNIEYGSKMKVMVEIIKHSIRLGDKVIVFGSHLAELDMTECFLQENGWKKNESYLRMDGTVPPDARMACCNKFNYNKDNEIKIFLVSHQVGGLGLNLTAANRIILMDVNFNPAHDTQSIFRAYRFGQEKRCYVYRLVSIGTMEEVIYERSVTKLAVSLRVVDEHQISRHYKSNDLQKMYRFKIYTDEEKPIVKLPADEVLASILEKCKQIFKYHMHQDLLENRLEEQLNAEEQRLAWAEFRQEQEAGYQAQVAANNTRLQNLQNIPPNVSSTSTTTSSAATLTSSTNIASTTSHTNLQQKQHEEICPKIVFVNRPRLRSSNLQNFKPSASGLIASKAPSTMKQQSQPTTSQVILPLTTAQQQPINASGVLRVSTHPTSFMIPGLKIIPKPTVTALPVASQSNGVITAHKSLNNGHVNNKSPKFVTTTGTAVIPSTSGVTVSLIPSTSGVTVSRYPTRRTSLSSIRDGQSNIIEVD